MTDRNKTKEQLLHELAAMRKRVTKIEAKETIHERTEQSLRESEEWFRTLTEASSEGITVTEKGVILDLNEQHAKMHGYSRGELIGKTLLDVVAPESQLAVKEAIQKESSCSFEILSLRKDGTTFPAEVRGKITKFGGRTVRISTIRDLSRWKHAEETLKHERNLLRTVIDNLPDAIYVKDKNCRKTIANVADLNNMNVSEEAEAIGKTDFEFFTAEAAAAFYTDDYSVLQSGKAILNREECFVDKDGKKHWLLTSKLPLKNEEGEIGGIVGIGRNITEQKQVEEELRHERNLLRTLIDSMPELINYKDAEGRYLLNNRAHLRILGVEHQEDVLGKTMYDFHPPELVKQYEETEKHLVRTGETIFDKEENVLHHDTAKIHWHLTSKVPLKDAQGKVTSYITISTDITERKRMEEALRETADKFRFVFENAYDGISIFEQIPEKDERRLVDCNERYAEMAGRSREELLQIGTTLNISKQISESSNESTKHGVVLSGSFSWIRPDGKENVIEYTAVPIKMQGKIFTIGIDRDVTERKRAEAERERLITELRQALSDIKTLSGLVPICANCKKIRDDKGYWTQVEAYIQEHSQARFSHGICPDCMKNIYLDFVPKEKE